MKTPTSLCVALVFLTLSAAGFAQTPQSPLAVMRDVQANVQLKNYKEAVNQFEKMTNTQSTFTPPLHLLPDVVLAYERIGQRDNALLWLTAMRRQATGSLRPSNGGLSVTARALEQNLALMEDSDVKESVTKLVADLHQFVSTTQPTPPTPPPTVRSKKNDELIAQTKSDEQAMTKLRALIQLRKYDEAVAYYESIVFKAPYSFGSKGEPAAIFAYASAGKADRALTLISQLRTEIPSALKTASANSVLWMTSQSLRDYAAKMPAGPVKDVVADLIAEIIKQTPPRR